MLTSLPTLSPPDAHKLWYPSLSSQSYQPPASDSSQPARQSRSQPSRHNNAPPARTLLSILRADENAIRVRKENIRRLGAGWLRPPGVTKTLQGMIDERVEREEQEAAASREQALADAQAAAEAEAEAEARDTDMAMLEEDESGAEDRDLDDDIPDADADADDAGEWVDEDADDALPTDEGDGDYAEDTGVDMGGGMEGRDLDDDVPEAGSYQHTDTDVEDESSSEGDDEMDEPRQMMPGGRAIMGGSVFGSSPAAPASGLRRSGGFVGRAGPGRENQPGL